MIRRDQYLRCDSWSSDTLPPHQLARISPSAMRRSSSGPFLATSCHSCSTFLRFLSSCFRPSPSDAEDFRVCPCPLSCSQNHSSRSAPSKTCLSAEASLDHFSAGSKAGNVAWAPLDSLTVLGTGPSGSLLCLDGSNTSLSCWRNGLSTDCSSWVPTWNPRHARTPLS